MEHHNPLRFHPSRNQPAAVRLEILDNRSHVVGSEHPLVQDRHATYASWAGGQINSGRKSRRVCPTEGVEEREPLFLETVVPVDTEPPPFPEVGARPQLH